MRIPEIRDFQNFDLSAKLKPHHQNNSNPQNYDKDQKPPQKTDKPLSIIDLFLNNTKKVDSYNENMNKSPKNYEKSKLSPKNYEQSRNPTFDFPEKTQTKNFEFQGQNTRNLVAKARPFEDKYNENYATNFTKNNNRGPSEKSRNYNENRDNSNYNEKKSSEKSHQYNQKSHTYIEASRNPLNPNERSKFMNRYFSRSPKNQGNLDFQPILPENIESDNMYLQQPQSKHHQESSKYIESHKDFSIFGQFIASDASNINIKKNTSHKSISPLKIEERSILQKSRSSRFGMQEEESVGRTHKNHNKYQNDTLHNASASVLSNMGFGLKSFVSNRPEFSNVRNDTNMNVNRKN